MFYKLLIFINHEFSKRHDDWHKAKFTLTSCKVRSVYIYRFQKGGHKTSVLNIFLKFLEQYLYDYTFLRAYKMPTMEKNT